MYTLFQKLRFGEICTGSMGGTDHAVVKWAKGAYKHGEVWNSEGEMIASW